MAAQRVFCLALLATCSCYMIRHESLTVRLADQGAGKAVIEFAGSAEAEQWFDAYTPGPERRKLASIWVQDVRGEDCSIESGMGGIQRIDYPNSCCTVQLPGCIIVGDGITIHFPDGPLEIRKARILKPLPN